MTDIGQAIMDAINTRREDPNTPRCDHWWCRRPAMIIRPFNIGGIRNPDEKEWPPKEAWLTLCEECEDGLLWASNGYIPTIRKLLAGYNLKTGELSPQGQYVATLGGKVIEECKKYGLEEMAGGDPVHLFDVLLRHVYNNRDMVFGLKDHTIETMQSRIAEAVDILDTLDEANECTDLIKRLRACL